MNASTEPTTLSTWALAIARTMETLGHDSQAAFKAAGLDYEAARDPNARFPVSGMTRLWHEARRVSGDPAIGLKVGEQVQPASLHALGLSVLASETPGDALQRVARYSRIVSNAANIHLQRNGELVELQFRIPDHGIELAYEAFDAFICNIVKLGRMLAQRDVNPVRIELIRPQPDNTADYERLFCCPIRFQADLNRILFEAKYLDEPLPSANPELAQLNDKVIVDYLARFDRSQITVQVRNLIIQRLPSGEPAQDEVATALNMSTRSLQRRLSEEKSSYKELLEDTRKELAGQYLKRSDVSLGEITYLLGFSDQSNFNRAFKRWFGQTPGEFRAAA